MLKVIIFMLASVLHTIGASQHGTECPQSCLCEDSAVLCEGSGIPQIRQRTTTFQLKNANPPILELSPAITRHLQHLVRQKQFSCIAIRQ